MSGADFSSLLIKWDGVTNVMDVTIE